MEGPVLFLTFNQKKCELRYKMDCLESNLYGTYNDSGYKNDKKKKKKIFVLHCLMKRDGINRMFPFAKRGIGE